LKTEVEKIALKNGFKNFRITIENGSDLGYTGVLKKYRIIENERELPLMCKFLPEDEKQNESFKSFLLFKQEVIVYQQLLPEFEKLQFENGFNYRDSNGFWLYPMCYYSHYDHENPTKSIIIMEDLTATNFRVRNKFVPSDYQHTRKLFGELAKFHALSLVMKERKPKVFERFKQMKCSMYLLMTTESMRHLAPRNIELACKLFNEGEIRDKLMSFRDCLWERVQTTLNGNSSEPFSSVVHGDVWINNVMYNYHGEDDQEIKDIRLVDWQMTFYGSVGSELLYYLFCCVDKPIRDLHQKELLSFYYDEMGTFLEKFSLNIEKTFPLSEFEEQLRKFGIYSFAMATFALPLLCKYPQQLFEDENAELSEEERENLNNYNRRMRSTILDMIQMQIL
jgi:hypothetical protein